MSQWPEKIACVNQSLLPIKKQDKQAKKKTHTKTTCSTLCILLVGISTIYHLLFTIPKAKKKYLETKKIFFDNKFVSKTWTHLLQNLRELSGSYLWSAWWDVCCCRNITVFEYMVPSQALLGLISYIGYGNFIILLPSKIFWILKHIWLQGFWRMGYGSVPVSIPQVLGQKSRGDFLLFFS